MEITFRDKFLSSFRFRVCKFGLVSFELYLQLGHNPYFKTNNFHVSLAETNGFHVSLTQTNIAYFLYKTRD